MFQPPRGTRDFLPEDMIKRQYVLYTIWKVFEKWGFDPLETPAFEDFSLLTAKAGDEIRNEIYYFKDKSERELGLRFDLTVPLARVVVNNPNIPKPFRRYQIGPVWRYDRPGAGRYREFWQADIDIVGSPSGEADAICIAAVCDAMKELGFSDFFVRLNNRKIVEAFLLSIGLKEKVRDVMRSIDKLEKMGEKNVSKELNQKKIGPEKIKKIMEFTKIKNLSGAKKHVEKEKLGAEGIDEIEKIIEYLDVFGFGNYARFDLSLVRGLEYYTGPVFEVSANIGQSVGGGGRYDNLVQAFGGKPAPATGISFGVDRLVIAMGKKLKLPKTNTKIYIAPVNENVKKDAMAMARQLISMNMPTEFDLMNRSLSKQLDYANAKGIPYVIVLGEKEIKSNRVKLRNMQTGEEKEINLSELEVLKKSVK